MNIHNDVAQQQAAAITIILSVIRLAKVLYQPRNS